MGISGVSGISGRGGRGTGTFRSGFSNVGEYTRSTGSLFGSGGTLGGLFGGLFDNLSTSPFNTTLHYMGVDDYADLNMQLEGYASALGLNWGSPTGSKLSLAGLSDDYSDLGVYGDFVSRALDTYGDVFGYPDSGVSYNYGRGNYSFDTLGQSLALGKAILGDYNTAVDIANMGALGKYVSDALEGTTSNLSLPDRKALGLLTTNLDTALNTVLGPYSTYKNVAGVSLKTLGDMLQLSTNETSSDIGAALKALGSIALSPVTEIAKAIDPETDSSFNTIGALLGVTNDAYATYSDLNDRIAQTVKDAAKGALGYLGSTGAFAEAYKALYAGEPTLQNISTISKLVNKTIDLTKLAGIDDTTTKTLLSALSGISGFLADPVKGGLNLGVDVLTSAIADEPVGSLSNIVSALSSLSGGVGTTATRSSDTTYSALTGNGDNYNEGGGGNVATLTDLLNALSGYASEGGGEDAYTALYNAILGDADLMEALGLSSGNGDSSGESVSTTGTYSSADSIVGGGDTITMGTVTNDQLNQILRDYAASRLTAESGVLTAADEQYMQDMINAAYTPLQAEEERQMKALLEGAVTRGLGAGSGPVNEMLADLASDYGGYYEEAASKASASAYELIQQRYLAELELAIAAGKVPLGDALNWYLAKTGASLDRDKLDASVYASNKASEAAKDSSLASGIGSIIGTLGTPVLSSLSSLLGSGIDSLIGLFGGGSDNASESSLLDSLYGSDYDYGGGSWYDNYDYSSSWLDSYLGGSSGSGGSIWSDDYSVSNYLSSDDSWDSGDWW